MQLVSINPKTVSAFLMAHTRQQFPEVSMG